ncbi:MAG: hypothetical protein LBR24_03880, partial [Methanobrevibacter sp.]|nr:hypothetical protein [Methanobrevibacter sp.]
MEKIEKIKTTINIEKPILQVIKQIALNKETTQTEIIKNYIIKGIENEENSLKQAKEYDCDLLLEKLE